MNAPENKKKEKSNRHEIHKDYLFYGLLIVRSSSVLLVPDKWFPDHLTFTDGTNVEWSLSDLYANEITI